MGERRDGERDRRGGEREGDVERQRRGGNGEMGRIERRRGETGEGKRDGEMRRWGDREEKERGERDGADRANVEQKLQVPGRALDAE